VAACCALLLASFLLQAAPATPAAVSATANVKLATWNLEWLLTPDTFHLLKEHCLSDDGERRAARRQLPCDVAHGLERSATDLAALRRHAERLDADVVALQEVDGVAAARQLFRDHGFCFSGSTLLQNTGFAIRRGIPYRCEPDVTALSLGDTLRRGAAVVLFPESPRELHLLSVHLKSGCARQPLDGGTRACATLAQQVPALAAWATSQARAGHRFAVLGDFNRDLLGEGNTTSRSTRRTVLGELNAGAPSAAQLHSAAKPSDFRNCARGQRHSGFIDYILLGTALADRRVPGSVERLVWSSGEAARRILSDHCPLAVRVRP
jgi:endonuclease/exonuclease/phosphatase family metal-dependent hydrolase